MRSCAEILHDLLGVTILDSLYLYLRRETLLQVDYVETVLDRQLVRGSLVAVPTIAPGVANTMAARWNLENAGGCRSVGDVDHGNLVIHLDNAITVSRGF